MIQANTRTESTWTASTCPHLHRQQDLAVTLHLVLQLHPSATISSRPGINLPSLLQLTNPQLPLDHPLSAQLDLKHEPSLPLPSVNPHRPAQTTHPHPHIVQSLPAYRPDQLRIKHPPLALNHPSSEQSVPLLLSTLRRPNERQSRKKSGSRGWDTIGSVKKRRKRKERDWRLNRGRKREKSLEMERRMNMDQGRALQVLKRSRRRLGWVSELHTVRQL